MNIPIDEIAFLSTLTPEHEVVGLFDPVEQNFTEVYVRSPWGTSWWRFAETAGPAEQDPFAAYAASGATVLWGRVPLFERYGVRPQLEALGRLRMRSQVVRRMMW